MKLLAILGTRPEAIKMAPVILQAKHDVRFKMEVCVTAQHREMLDQVLELFNIQPDYDLDIMRMDQNLFDVTLRSLTGLKRVLQEGKPDYVLVQGDTTTTFMGALAAFYQQIPVGHIEAGLRTHNLQAPFPEEANRHLTSVLAFHHFAPTQQAMDHLIKENVDPNKIFITGNTIVDALQWMRHRIKYQPEWNALFGTAQKILHEPYPVILVTGHRRESFGEGFQNICHALAHLAKQHPDWHMVYPVHLNPHVQQPVKTILSEYENIHLIEPLSYEPFIYLMNRSKLILTDSGGIQEEAPSLGKPVLIMREVTERAEAIQAGSAILVGTDVKRIIQETEDLMNNVERYRAMSQNQNPFGDGHASIRILNQIAKDFKDKIKQHINQTITFIEDTEVI